MPTPSHNANGHRRREVVKRVLAEETLCALCDTPVDKTLTMTPGAHGKKCPGGQGKQLPGGLSGNTDGACPGCIPDPMRYEVDEDLPRSRGGSPYDRKNCHLLHRSCNQYKSNLTLDEARAKLDAEQHGTTTTPRTTVAASSIW